MFTVSRFLQAAVAAAITGCGAMAAAYQGDNMVTAPEVWTAGGAVLASFAAIYWTRTNDDGKSQD